MKTEVSLYKTAVSWFLPLLFINITTSANNWQIFGIYIGQTIYWLLIVIAWYISSKSPYFRIATTFLILALLLRASELFLGSEGITGLRIAALAVVFIIAGANAYGKNPALLHRQLIIFIGLSIPIMLLQIMGVSSYVMMWNTEYAHDTSVLDIDEIGTFKEIQVYETLFTSYNKLYYQIGQGRPVGLLYSNNVFSVFLAIAFSLNLSIRSRTRITKSDVITTIAIVLAMSKMAYTIMGFLCLMSLFFGIPAKRKLALKIVLLVIISYFLYYLFFPGLFQSHFSEVMILSALIPRLIDVLRSLGLNSIVSSLMFEYGTMLAIKEDSESLRSGFAILLSLKWILPLLLVSMVAGVLYLKRVQVMRKFYGLHVVMPYIVTIFVCFITQFAVPYFAAISFQVIFGFAAFSMFKKLWQPKKRQFNIESKHII